MNNTPMTPGTPLEGGYYAGRIVIESIAYALIVAPKAEGEHQDTVWIPRNKDVPGARSYNDGLANTIAMAEAGSKLAQWALKQRIGGFSDWYIHSIDELEICYRHLKPGTTQNSCYARSGINLNSDPPTHPYTPEFPLQTTHDLFRAGGAEAFDAVAYWSSTQHASGSYGAWGQDFDDGNQDNWDKSGKLRARLVRRLPI